MPLFVAITAGMTLCFAGEESGDGGEGGPRRGFAEAKDATQPRPS